MIAGRAEPTPSCLRQRAALAAAALSVVAQGNAGAQGLPELDPTGVDEGAELRVYEEAPQATAPRAGLPQIRRDFDGGGFVRLYGHVNWGVMNYDDGRDGETYAPLDNANSVSRLGLLASLPLEGGWGAGFRGEVGYAPYSSFSVSQLDDDPDFDFDEDNIRWIDLYLSNDDYGRASLGQGSMATDGVTLIDFSGTNLVAYSSVADSAGGQFLRFADPALAIGDAPTVGQAFQGFDGPRRVRVRYDTPTLNGFGASAAYGRNLLTTASGQSDEDLFDLSLTYGGEVAGLTLGAAAGYFWDRDDRESFAGSGSVLHEATGLNLSVAGGMLDSSGRTADYVYAKLGLRRELFAFGTTAVSVDYYAGDDIVRSGSDSDSWGVALVQTVDPINTELWLTWRVYGYDERTAEFEDGRVVFGGVRFRF